MAANTRARWQPAVDLGEGHEADPGIGHDLRNGVVVRIHVVEHAVGQPRGRQARAPAVRH
jgi:hypothetical protein